MHLSKALNCFLKSNIFGKFNIVVVEGEYPNWTWRDPSVPVGLGRAEIKSCIQVQAVFDQVGQTLG